MIAFRKDVLVLLALGLFAFGGLIGWLNGRGRPAEAPVLRVLTTHRLTNQESPVLLGERMEGTNRVRLWGVPTVVADAHVCGTAEESASGTCQRPLFRVLQMVGASTNLVTVTGAAEGKRAKAAETNQPAGGSATCPQSECRTKADP